jgi:hypothetical protein
MPKVKSEFIRVGHESDPDFIKFRFSVDININAKGVFYSYMPADVLQRMQYGNVKFDTTLKKGREGCFSGSTIAEVIGKIKEACREASSRQQVSETIVIKYAIRTACSYCKDVKGDIVPNGERGWVKTDSYEWRQGTVNQHATSPQPFGFEMYAKPFYKREYLYCNGRTSVEYAPLFARVDKTEQFYLAWLEGVAAVTAPDETKVQEIEYTEEVARFFVETYKSLCILNERIKGFLDPEGIRQIAASKLKMLNNG